MDNCFYKNVDICDLESIVEKGILSLNASENNNWDDGRRADNSKDVVYLFKPALLNCLKMYGLALLEIDPATEAQKNDFCKNDHNQGNYEEFTVDYVSPESIVNIYLPDFLKSRIEPGLSQKVLEKVRWIPFKAYKYSPTDEPKSIQYKGNYYVECNEYEYSLMLKDTCKLNSCDFNYFRGFDNNELICDYSILFYEIGKS